MQADEVKSFFKSCTDEVAIVGAELNSILTGLGCENYIKTIYLGFEFDGQMIAAVYPHRTHLEIALALPDDFLELSKLFIDAAHLKWRTLPIAAILRSSADLLEIRDWIDVSFTRVKSGSHDVSRDNDYFMNIKRRGRHLRGGKKDS